MAVAVKKSAKIKPYKFVDTKVAISKDSPETQKTLVKSLEKQQQSINNLGVTLNSIASVLKDFRDNQAKLVQLQADSGPKFEARYTTRSGPVKKGGEAAEGTPSMSLPKIGFLESLMGFLKNTVGAAIGVAALDWLSDTNNQKKVKDTITLMVDIMKAIVGFVGAETKDFIDDMYTLLSDESTPLEKFGVVLERIGKFGVAFLAIRYLKNPLKIVNDLGAVLGFFNKNLLNSRNVLIRRASKIAALAAGALLLAKAFENKDEIKAGAEKATESTKEFLQTNEQVQQIKEVAKTSTEVAVEGAKQVTEAVQSRSIGGAVPLRAGGGWIDGPQTGYPVSLDGGRSTAFIGHGREYVAQKANGGFVIPVDTPATRGNPNLTGLRMSQASAAGYDLGGMFDSMASGGRRRKRGEQDGDVSKGFKYGKLMASGGNVSLTSNGGRPLVNKRLLKGQKYKYGDLMPHSHNITTATVYDGISMGPGKDYGVGKLPQYMPSGPNGLIPTPQAGEVLRSGDINNGYGKSVLVKGPLGVMGFHHLSRIASGVKQGSRVSAGKIVGTQGNTGGNYAEHLHLNATPKGHEAFVNYVTTGKPIAGSSAADGSNEPRQTTSALQLSGYSKQRVDAMGGDRFLTPFIAMCKRLKADPAAMLGKMASESGILPNKQASSGAMGLIQFTPRTWNGLGTGKPHSWLRSASGIEQLPYIEKFLKPTFAKAPKDSRGMVSDGHVYVSTFLPAFVEGDANTVIMTSSGVLPEESKKLHSPSVGEVRAWWADNDGLDGYNPATGKADPAMKDGKVTIAELAGRIAAKKKEYGISGGITSGSAINFDSDGNAITPSSSASAIPPGQPPLTMETLSSGLAGGLAAFAKALGADIDVEAFKARFEGVSPGELPSTPADTKSSAASESIEGFKLPENAFNMPTSSIPSSPRSTFKSAFTGESLLPEGTDIDLNKLFTNDKLNFGFGDGSGSDMKHFRPGGGNDAGNGASKIKPSTVKPESISAAGSGGGGGTASGALPAASGAAASAQQSMVQQTKVNIDSRPQREGSSGEILQRMAASAAEANRRVQQLRSEGAQAVSDANRAAQPTHSVRTQKSGGESISLVDQLNSVNNILG